jgi:hypothetical protein
MNIEEVKFDEELYNKNIEENEFSNEEDGIGEKLEINCYSIVGW